MNKSDTVKEVYTDMKAYTEEPEWATVIWTACLEEHFISLQE